MTSKSRQAPIQFTGPPANLTAAVDWPFRETLPPEIEIAGQKMPLRITGDAEKITSLAFSLPGDTAPGGLEGKLFLDGVKRSAKATVELHPIASIDPATIELRAPAGKQATATLNVTNRGNGDLTFDVDSAVTVRESGVLGRSVASAFKQTNHDVADRLIALGEKMREARSHELPVAGRMSPATLKVGGHTKVTLKLDIPTEIDPEVTWTGSFALLGTRLRVEVEPTSTQPPG